MRSYTISVSTEENAPGGMVLARFYRPGGLEVLKSCLPVGWGWSGLELTDTLQINDEISV